MKKLIALMLLAVMVSLPASAQVKFGVMAGANMSNMSLKDIPGSVKTRTGFFVGPTVRFTLPIVAIGVDASALYDQREGKVGDETIKSQSIQIPINIRGGLSLGSVAEVFLFAGPQFGFNVGKDKSLKGLYKDATQWTLKSSNLSANVGLGAVLLNHLQVKFNYNFALGKTGEFKVGDKVHGSAKLNTWQASLAYYF